MYMNFHIKFGNCTKMFIYWETQILSPEVSDEVMRNCARVMKKFDLMFLPSCPIATGYVMGFPGR